MLNNTSFRFFPRNFYLIRSLVQCKSYHFTYNCGSHQFLRTYFENHTANTLFKRICDGDRSALSRAITLVESQHPLKRSEAQDLLNLVIKKVRKDYVDNGEKPNSFRIGVTGPPGAGKSTFIETFGKVLTRKGHKVAVLTIDPSSSTTGGSLLGDKTRMPELSRDTCAFIRPSPASGCLGGVTRSTNETIALCECAGYDIVLVETVGVGQSEFHVSYMVDMFVLIVSPAGGDELQGLKKGIFELVDLVVINKVDGDLTSPAKYMQSEYISALKFIRRRFKNWRPLVCCVSSKENVGIKDVWDKMLSFREDLSQSRELYLNRKKQYSMWMWLYIENTLLNTFKKHPKVKSIISEMENKVEEGVITPGQASDILLKRFYKAL